MKIKCLLVDDEPLALDALESLIGKIPELEIIGKCQNVVEALQVIHNKEIDLLLLDIQMPEITGIEMLKSLVHPLKVIFTTAYREYAVEAFELDVIDYLVKPISLERLIRSINRYHDRISQRPGSQASEPETSSKTITIYSDKKTHRVITSSILYIEGLKDYAPKEAYDIIIKMENKSIYDGNRLALPDEVWNYKRGDGIEKAVLFANYLLNGQSIKSIKIVINTNSNIAV